MREADHQQRCLEGVLPERVPQRRRPRGHQESGHRARTRLISRQAAWSAFGLRGNQRAYRALGPSDPNPVAQDRTHEEVRKDPESLVDPYELPRTALENRPGPPGRHDVPEPDQETDDD